MQRLRIDPEQVDSVFISHGHGDHTGGLHTFLRIHSVPVYLPFSCPQLPADIEVIRIKGLVQIYPDIYSTGELNRIEQSLLVRQNSKITVITGCSHPGVGEILNTASAIGTVSALVGGLHGFGEFDLLKPLNTIVPCHCIKYISTIKTLYPDKYIEGGAGRIIEIE